MKLSYQNLCYYNQRMHKSVYQNAATVSPSYFRRQNNVSPLKPIPFLNASCVKTNISHDTSSRVQIQSIYQLQSCTDHKKSLKERINDRINKEMSHQLTRRAERNLNTEENQSKVKQILGKQNGERLSCIRKMLFEDEYVNQEKQEDKQNRCHNKSKLRRQRMQKRKQFDERQQKLLQSRLQKSALGREEQNKSQMKECTFKPKLTKYNPFI